jgi:hypothetical protein
MLRQNISKALASSAVFCARYRLLRPLALLLAVMHKRYHARLVDIRAKRESASGQAGWWWLSFVDEDMPAGQRFVGVAIVQGHGVASAASRAHELGVNPGGAVKALELSGADIPAPALRNRLLSMDELKEAGLV